MSKKSYPLNQVRNSKSKSNKEDTSLAQQNRDLRKQLRFLQRSYNRLVKEIESGKYGPVDIDGIEEEGDFDENAQQVIELLFCGKCSSENVKTIELQRRDGQRKYVICQSCGHREAMKPKKF